MRRPSASFVIGVMGLAVAFAGTAVAANGGVAGKHPDAKADTKLFHSLLNKAAPSLSVKHAKSADHLTFLPSGQSESGMFGAGGGNSTSGYIGYGLTYPRPLATAIPNSHIVDISGTSYTSVCPGPGHAARGYLCLYDSIEYSVDPGYGYSEGFGSPSYGVVLYWPVNGSVPYSGGEWTVTAP